MPRFGGCLHFLIRPSCCCYACFNAAPLPPPLGLWAKRRLKALRIFPPRRSSFCYTLPLLDEPALHAQLCRFLNTSEPLARFLRCQRPFVSLRWASYATMQRQVAFETTHPALLLPSPATPFPPPPVPQTSITRCWVILSLYPYEPRASRKVSSDFAPSSLTAKSWPSAGRLRVKACGNRREVFSTRRCSGRAIDGKLSAVRRDGPR